ncbi:(2Fe-2S)-binding protein [bacterium]|nr:(2Fe-2S)-binding protein [bacterium]
MKPKRKTIELFIDGKKVKGFENQTILEVALKSNIEIPALCYHSDLKIKGNCRLCVVEIKGRKGLFPACSTLIEPKMEVITDSKLIRRARRINLELIFAQHCEECNDCIWSFNCQLLKLAKKYRLNISRFPDRKKEYPVYQFGPSLIFDSSKCVDCRNCVEVCKKQGVGFLKIKQKGHLFQIVPDETKECVYCGQCIVHCPVGAFEAVGEFEDVEKPLSQKDKIVIFQFAPSIRTSIGEEFGLPYGTVVTGKLIAGLKKIGADKVFDVSVGADFTTFEEAKEFIKRLKQNKHLPMFTSCCPSWVRFVEVYAPDFVPFLTSVRSPHIILGGLIKTFWAEKQGLDPKKIVVVSIMPCVAKKYEIQRKELFLNGLKPVDYVLTTRELAYLFLKKGINLKKIKPEKPDDPLGLPTGAGVIYGASGGVMESALRTAFYFLKVKQKLERIEFKKVRGMQGMKQAVIDFNGKKIKVAVVNGLGNAKELLEKIRNKPDLYDYVEVMACFGGCIGGGGQPVPTDKFIREKRAKALYRIDKGKKIRLAHKNPIVLEVYKKFFKDKQKVHFIAHTRYFPLKKKKNEQSERVSSK